MSPRDHAEGMAFLAVKDVLIQKKQEVETEYTLRSECPHETLAGEREALIALDNMLTPSRHPSQRCRKKWLRLSEEYVELLF